MDNRPAIRVSNLCYNYRSHWTLRRSPALRNVSFDVYQGEAFGFLGPNGAGKTTTIKCLLNLIKPASGEILLFGRNASEPSSRSAIGYLPEHPYFYDHLTVEELMIMYAQLSGVSGNLVRSAVMEALERVGMAARLKSRMRTLSKGLTQRVAMAQAIVANPKLLILDEPFSGLDPVGRREFRDLIRSLKSAGTTIFMSSHVLSDVEALCDRISIMADGVLQGVFEVRELPRSNGASYELVIRNRSSDGAIETLAALAESVDSLTNSMRMIFSSKQSAETALKTALEKGFEIESYQFMHGSLEELFIEIVSRGQEG
ncbi:MAG: ABC transporter ATP-binding protein [Deltaproteobacteria bacterium]|nr:ABC transporter ATP-binding protein [Deltaproteobacteria bacterium]